MNAAIAEWNELNKLNWDNSTPQQAKRIDSNKEINLFIDLVDEIHSRSEWEWVIAFAIPSFINQMNLFYYHSSIISILFGSETKKEKRIEKWDELHSSNYLHSAINKRNEAANARWNWIY